MNSIGKCFCLLILVLASLGAVGQDTENLLKNGDFSESLKNWETVGAPEAFKVENGALTVSIPRSGNALDYRIFQRIQLKPGVQYKLFLTLEGNLARSRYITISYRMKDKAFNLGFYTRAAVLNSRLPLAFDIIPLYEPDVPGDPAILTMYLGELEGSLKISNIRLVEYKVMERNPLPFSDKWQIFSKVMPDAEVINSIPELIPGKDGKAVVPQTIIKKTSLDGNGNRFSLKDIAGTFKFRDAAIICNEFESDRDRLLMIGCAADWWWEVRLNGELLCSNMLSGNNKKTYTPDDNVFYLPVKKGRNLFVAKVLAGSQGWQFVWGLPAPEEPIRFKADAEYKPIDIAHPAIKAGSALDLSALADAPAGKYGRAVLGSDGLMRFEKNDKVCRFKGYTSNIPEEFWKNVSDEEFNKNAVELARVTRAQGYNFFRMHGIDEWIMTGTTEDLAFSPKYLDRWDRIVAEMKKQGIYLQMVGFSFGLYSASQSYWPVLEARNMHKVMFLAGRPWERERFKAGVTKLMNHVNPYTGLAWKDDPAIVIFDFYNELGLGIGGPRIPEIAREYPEDYKFFLGEWAKFLHKRYSGKPSVEWPEELRKSGLDSPFVPYQSHVVSQLGVDFDTFIYEKLKETHIWCEKTVREAGYSGLLTNCTMPALNFTPANWETLPVVDAHTYYEHPTSFESTGSRIGKKSSVENVASMFRDMHGRRLYGRPFMVGEFNHCFWNPYQYELPLAFSAYAALNNWSSMAIHWNPVYLWMPEKTICHCFDVGASPVLRSGEFLASMIFLREDIRPAPHRMALLLGKDYIFSKERNSSKALSDKQSRLGLLTDFSVICPDLPLAPGLKTPPAPDMSLKTWGAAEVEWCDWVVNVKESKGDSTALVDTVNEMRKNGILPAGNITDPDKEIYQSETGEITLRAKESLIKVVTPKTEAVALLANKSEMLDVLKINSSSIDSLIGVTSIDNISLRDSKRMVLVYSTRMANTNMQLDADGETLRTMGTAPVLMRTGRFSVDLDNKNAKSMKCYALRLDGERMQELPLHYEKGILNLTVDTAVLKNGPAAFFELIAE